MNQNRPGEILTIAAVIFNPSTGTGVPSLTAQPASYEQFNIG